MTPARLLPLLLAFLAMIGVPVAAATMPPRPQHVAMDLSVEGWLPGAGGEGTIAIAAAPQPGWHAYWQNPGDAGIAPTATWTLPPGWRVGQFSYPVPERLLIAGLMNYVYERPFALLATLRVPPGTAAGGYLVSVKLDYLVCTREVCVPETQTVGCTVRVGKPPAGCVQPTARFDDYRRALPRPLGSTATWQKAGDRFRLSVPYPADAALGQAYFYPAAPDTIAMAAPQTVTRDGDRVVIETQAASPAGRVAGVLATGDGRGLSIVARPGTVAAAASGADRRTAALAFAGAVLGGLLLNVMPCVFPILSLKALGLARSGESEAHARAEAVAYAAGVISVCLALGGVLLALRAGGSAAGWAFQLQDPRVIGVLLLLTAGIALNLSGVFELPTPRFAATGGRGGGRAGAFATGALAAFVATPCSGPFMGAALGAALVLPVAAALLVFAGLGLGIALPFLLIGFVPALRRRMPRPGAWMATFRRVLAVPMWLTALALAWVLGRQAGVDGMTQALGAALLLALGLWIAGRRQAAGKGGAVPVAIAIVLALAAVATLRPAPRVEAAVAGAEPFSEARLAALRAEGRPVFAYFTADWCLSCKVNEKTAIETDAVRDAFAKGKVAVLVGDWTDGDPALGRFIARHDRAGVPLYLWYAPGAAAPRVLPQLLTKGMLTALPAGG